MQQLVSAVQRINEASEVYLTKNTPSAAQDFINVVFTELDSPQGIAALDDAKWTHEAAAAKTKSDKYYGKVIPAAIFRDALDEFIAAANRLDAIKKAMFYGKPFDGFFSESTCDMLPNFIGGANASMFAGNASDTRKRGVDILHSIIGSCTEAGEKAELITAVLDGGTFDHVGFMEETGDGRWYDAIGIPAIGMTLAAVDRANEQKLLRKRFKSGGFTEQAAQVRDLNAERAGLEASAAIGDYNSIGQRGHTETLKG